VSPLDELRESLRAAARRDVDARRRVRRRRQRRLTGVLAALLVGGAAVAGAADLIAVGEPVADVRVLGDDYRPPPGALRPQILVRAKAPGLELPYGLGAYTANNGKRCLVPGALLGYTLGVVDGNEFKPYQRGKVGTCNIPGRINQDLWHDHGRTLLFGVASAATPHPIVTVDGRSYRPRTYGERAFLLIFKGDFDVGDIRVSFVR
jgi:hypothetical protein